MHQPSPEPEEPAIEPSAAVTEEPIPDLRAVVERRSIGRLDDPGPTAAQLAAMLEVAGTAPDHGRLRPWRFIVLRGPAREELGAAFARAVAARTPDTPAAELDKVARKALRAPVIVAVIARTVPHRKVQPWEQVVAAGCATQNLCIAATAYGFGSMWRTGWLVEHPAVLTHLGLDAHEQVVGLVYLGTVPDDFEPPPREVEAPDVVWRG